MMKIIDKVLVGASLLGFSGFLLADPLDYSGFTGAVDVATVSAAIVAMAVLKVGPNVASWASRKLAGFFR